MNVREMESLVEELEVNKDECNLKLIRFYKRKILKTLQSITLNHGIKSVIKGDKLELEIDYTKASVYGIIENFTECFNVCNSKELEIELGY